MKTLQQLVKLIPRAELQVEDTLPQKKKTFAPIEAHGVKGMKSTRWRKIFQSPEALEAWVEKNDAEVWGTRPLEMPVKESDAENKPIAKSFNDDDYYLLDKVSKKSIRNLGPHWGSSSSPEALKVYIKDPDTEVVMKGMKARMSGYSC